ncbi:MAG: histidinol-phosphatase [Chthoniobacteraceae bacterium]
MTPAPVLYETHMHTPLCRHAVGMPVEYAGVAARRGLRGITVTCHAPMPDGYSAPIRMTPEQFPVYVKMVAEAADLCKGQTEVLLGLESDYYPGVEPWLESLHQQADFHYILGSVHPHVPAYLKRFFTGDAFEYQKTYFDHMALAAETGLYDSLAHPDLVKNMDPEAWELSRIMPYIGRSLDRIAATGVAMELNTSGMNKAIAEMNPGPEILQEIQKRGIPVVIGADAHEPGRVADGYEKALKHLSTAGFQTISYFRERIRREVSVAEALESLS